MSIKNEWDLNYKDPCKSTLGKRPDCILEYLLPINLWLDTEVQTIFGFEL